MGKKRVNKKVPPQQSAHQENSSTWLDAVKRLYPDMLHRTYCVPPVYFNRLRYRKISFEGQHVFVHEHVGPPTTRAIPSTSISFPDALHTLSTERTSQVRGEGSIHRTRSLDSKLTAPSTSKDIHHVTATTKRSASDPCGVAALSVEKLLKKSGVSTCVTQAGAANSSAYRSCISGTDTAKAGDVSPRANVSEPLRSVAPATASPNSSSCRPYTSGSKKSKTSGVGPCASFKQPVRPVAPEATTASCLARPPSTRGTSAACWKHPCAMWTKEPGPDSKRSPVIESDFQDDAAQQLVLRNLQELGELGDQEHEVMFILSQVNFSNYLNNPCYAAAAQQLPRPEDLGQQDCRGDFDIVIIHRQHGILVAEVKSVGRNTKSTDADVKKRVERAVKQLDKSRRMMSHLVGDIAPKMPVKTALILPYVSETCLQRVLEADEQLKQSVQSCLEAESACTVVDMAKLCICSDALRDPQGPRENDPCILPTQLTNWWRCRMTCAVDNNMTDDVYTEIIARFVGPATTVSVYCVNCPIKEIRTEGQALSELGRRVARVVLTTDQLDLLNQALPRVFLAGPPGTGKTIVLVLVGLKWLRQREDVYVVSTRPGSLAVSSLIKHQLEKTLQEDNDATTSPGNVFLLHYDFYHCEPAVKKAVADLAVASKRGRELHILMDEPDFRDEILKPRYHEFFEALASRTTSFHMWVTSLVSTGSPSFLVPKMLTVPLRYLPVVHREIKINATKVNIEHSFVDYSVSSGPYPSDGPKVIYLNHHGDGHTTEWPEDCWQCGHNIGKVLIHRLHVGQTGSASTTDPAPLQFRDVFVLTRSVTLHDEVKDDAGNVTSEASGVIQGLRSEDIPVSVPAENYVRQMSETERQAWEREVESIAIAQNDVVTAAWYGDVRGLERNTVVWLPHRRLRVDDHFTDLQLELTDRLMIVSRATTQLIVVNRLDMACDQPALSK